MTKLVPKTTFNGTLYGALYGAFKNIIVALSKTDLTIDVSKRGGLSQVNLKGLHFLKKYWNSFFNFFRKKTGGNGCCCWLHNLKLVLHGRNFRNINQVNPFYLSSSNLCQCHKKSIQELSRSSILAYILQIVWIDNMSVIMWWGDSGRPHKGCPTKQDTCWFLPPTMVEAPWASILCLARAAADAPLDVTSYSEKGFTISEKEPTRWH